MTVGIQRGLLAAAFLVFLLPTLVHGQVSAIPWQGMPWGIIAIDKDRGVPQTNIVVKYSGGCAPIVGLQLRIDGRINEYRPLKDRINRVLAVGAQSIAELCPAMQTMQVGIISNNSRTTWAGETDRNRGWRIEAAEVSIERPGFTSVGFGRPKMPAGVKVDPDGSTEGYFQVRAGLFGSFTGTATRQEGAGDLVTYILEGMLYEHGDANRQCETAREGFAYWGSLQIRLESWNNVDGRGTFWPCSEDTGTAKGEVTLMKSAMGATDNPFNVIEAGPVITNAANNPATDDPNESILLASGAGWRLTTVDRYWCVNRTRLRMEYDVPHAERAKVFGGKFGPFFRAHVEPKLRETCPALTGVTIYNFRRGETAPWDRISLFQPRNGPPGLRVEYVNKDGAYFGQIYMRSCAACHATGAGGAPISGKPDDWSDHWNRLERASWDEVYHFNRLHCPDCDKQALENLARSMPKPGWTPVTSFSKPQRRMMAYANDPSVENLMKSGALNDAKAIAAIYQQRADLYPERRKLRSLFLDFIGIYDLRCGGHLPANARTYTFYVEDFNREVTATHVTDTITTRVGRTVRMDPKYYDTFAASPGTALGLSADLDNPLDAMLRDSGRLTDSPNRPIPAISANGANIMLRTADTRALLANDARCTDPAVKRYIDNLHRALQ